MDENKINNVLEILSSKWELNLAFNKEFYWEFEDYLVFGYNTLEYLENDDFSHALTGNFPIVLSKRENDEDIYQLTLEGEDHFQNSSMKILIENKWISRIDFRNPYDR